MSSRTAVIGAGLGGLSAAIRLARLGHEVQLFEKNTSLGGKMNRRILGDYYFDTGPSLLTMPFVIDELFDFTGFRREDFLTIDPIDPLCRYFFSDGQILDARVDPEQMATALHQLSPRDAKAYRRYFAYTQRIYHAAADIFLFTPIHEWHRLLRLQALPALFGLHRLDALRTVHESVSSYFSDPRIVQLFDRYATYNGSDPFSAPATLNIIPYVEYGLGGYYIREGMYRLVESLVEVAQRLGVSIHTGSRVERIHQANGRVCGLRVEGRNLDIETVVCNADVVSAHHQLLDDSTIRRKLSVLEPSLSGMVFLWGVRKQHEQLVHHNIFFSEDYRKEFEQIFHERRAPDDPTIYVAITSKTDRAHAPDGCENWFVLLNMPYLTGEQDWPANVHRMRRTVLEKLRSNGIDIQDSIEEEQIFTPEDFYSLYGSNRGSIYGISSNSRFTAFKRPPNRSRDLKGLYFAGGSTHPGGGIPLVLLSGKMAAELAHSARQQK